MLKSTNGRGIVLIVVLALLVVLSTICYTLTAKVSAQRHRNRYIIDYQAAQYARDSALKYALATLNDINEPNLITRADAPDFSDLFLLNESEYRQVLSDWAEQLTLQEFKEHIKKARHFTDANDPNHIDDINDSNEPTLLEAFSAFEPNSYDVNDPNLLVIPGPYGPPWPLITDPATFNIGSATVTIEIHDENAKYPIGWAMLTEPEVRREAQASFKTFCEWMDVNELTVDEVTDQLTELGKIKQYKLNFKNVKLVKEEKIRSVRARTRVRSRRSRTRTVTRTKKTVTEIPSTVHLVDFARLYHSSLLDTEALARPSVATKDRKESALKYIALWGSNKVNINSAPRQVLEAAFTFGGKADLIADEIIRRRHIKPFSDPNSLSQELFGYSDIINNCKQFITTKSNFFTIRVTAQSGVARASAIIVIRKTGDKTDKIAVLAS